MPQQSKGQRDLIQKFLAASLDAVIQMDASGFITEWNQQCESLFGRSRNEVIGLAFYNVLLPLRHRVKHQKTFAQGKTPTQPCGRLETEALHRLGHEFPIELTLTTISTEVGVMYCAHIRDIRERRQTEHDLNLARLTFESAEGMVIINTDLTILKVNVAFSTITGYSAADAVGKKSSIFRAERPELMRFWRLKNRRPIDLFWRGEVQDRRKCGAAYPVKLSVMAVANKQNLVTHFVIAFSDLSQHHKSTGHLHHLAFYDALTGLPNRLLMFDRLEQAQISSARSRSHGAVLLIDLDEFKNLNEALGHKIGDLMLTQVAQRLRACLHSTDTLARLTGDEFVVVLEGLDTHLPIAAEKADTVARRMIDTFAQPFDLFGHSHPASVSIGIRLFNDLSIDAAALVMQAETAMHQAKEVRCNAIRFFEAATQTMLQTRFKLIEWMRQGLPDQFLLHYQIQISNQGVPFGAEALIRWQHPEQGAISPAMFIPLAEESGFIIQIGAWVLQQACQQLVRWSQQPAMQALRLSINISAKQFNQKDFVSQVLATLAQTGANPALLELELTEGVMVRDVDAVIEKMLMLKHHGIRFSLDDFGTGYSSLSYLKRFPLDQLKIDQSFVRGVMNDPSDAAIVCAVITLGQSLGMAVIAEGVESDEQRDFLQAHGCQEFQGYLFGRPLAVGAFEALVHIQSAAVGLL